MQDGLAGNLVDVLSAGTAAASEGEAQFSVGDFYRRGDLEVHRKYEGQRTKYEAEIDATNGWGTVTHSILDRFTVCRAIERHHHENSHRGTEAQRRQKKHQGTKYTKQQSLAR